METISISIGDARSSTCIVLPRGHELVRHIEALLPSTSPATRAPSPEPAHYRYPQDARPQYPASGMPVVSPPRVPAALPSHAPVHPVHAPVHARPQVPSLPPTEQLHRSAAFIQSLLHRPTPTSSMSTDSSSSVPRNTYRRGRLATAAQNGSKRCQVPGCGKISVSRGVCRGHGGGRRCQFEGCAKSAQSRGDYCWSHGGGHRCEVPGCMRSRKSKRFCKNHLNWGSETPLAREMAPRVAPVLLPRAEAPRAPISPPPAPPVFHQSASRLPSLHQALQTHHTMVYGSESRDVSPMTTMGRTAFPTVMASSISC